MEWVSDINDADASSLRSPMDGIAGRHGMISKQVQKTFQPVKNVWIFNCENIRK